MASSVWRGTISFGLVSIPIRLYTAARSKRTFLHQIHNACNTRLKQPLYCPTCERIVDRSEVIKGYEYETGRYVLIDSDEIKKITPQSGKVMEIITFLDENAVDPFILILHLSRCPTSTPKNPTVCC
jgi:DNA end-binding protein Ku